MKIHRILGAALLLPALGAQAQEAAAPLWEAGLIAGYANTPSYPAASERASRALVVPYLIYRGEILRADRDGVGARVLYTQSIEIDLGVSASLPSSANDSPARRGMADLGTLIEMGPRLKLTLARPARDSRVQLKLPLRAVLEYKDGLHAQGLSLEPELNYEKRNMADGWSLAASASVMLGDRKQNNLHYGVAAPYATAARPAYDAQAGLIASRITLSTSKHLDADLRVFGFLRLESFAGSANRDSPLYVKSSASSIGLALAWTLGRSERRAGSPE